MTITLEQAAEYLKGRDDILILTHAAPDGDTLGCGYALLRALRVLGKRARLENSDDIAEKYAYMAKGVEEQQFEPKTVVSVDVADTVLLGDKLSGYGGSVDLCIDHHASNRLYAARTVVDPKAAAACELIYKLILLLDVPIDKAMADCIYTGLSTDTGCFRYTNTTARTHMIAAEMIKYGAEHGEINRVMFETKSRAYMELERAALDGMEFHFDGKCAMIFITNEMRQNTGVSPADTDGISTIPRRIEGVMVGITMKECDDGYKFSVRTNAPYDAAQLCAMMGGGGHSRAAGCRFNGDFDSARAAMLKTVEKYMSDVNDNA